MLRDDTIRYAYTGPVATDEDKRWFRDTSLRETFGFEYITSTDIYPIAGREIVCQPIEIDISGDGGPPVTLKGMLYFRSNHAELLDARLRVIFLSGSWGTASEYCREIVDGFLRNPDFFRLVKSVLVVDYRGFGRSRPTGPIRKPKDYVPDPAYMPGENALYTDARAMIDFMLNCRDPNLPGPPPITEDILLYGYSLGSGPATEMALNYPDIAGLILHGPMYSAEYMGNKSAPIIGGALSKRHIGFDNAAKITKVDCPILITVGPNDERMWQGASMLYEVAKRNLARGGKVHYAEHMGDHETLGAVFATDGQNPRHYLLRFLSFCLHRDRTPLLHRRRELP